MCLVTKNKEGLVSNEPVVCYKLYNKDREGRFVSPFRGICYNLKEGDEVIAEGLKEIKTNPCEVYYDLGEGFIHATTERWMPLFLLGSTHYLIRGVLENFLSLNLGKQCVDEELEETINYLAQHYRLCEMEIPTGERYWIEENIESFQRGICSNKMIFKREYKISKKSELLSIAIKMFFNEVEKERIQKLIEKYKEKGE